jgi:hypothetical protein
VNDARCTIAAGPKREAGQSFQPGACSLMFTGVSWPRPPTPGGTATGRRMLEAGLPLQPSPGTRPQSGCRSLASASCSQTRRWSGSTTKCSRATDTTCVRSWKRGRCKVLDG